MVGYARQSESSSPTPVAKNDHVDYQQVSDCTSKVNILSEHNKAYYSFNYNMPNHLSLYMNVKLCTCSSVCNKYAYIYASLCCCERFLCHPLGK